MIRVKAEQELMSEGPYSLDQDRRHLVLKALREVSSFRGWTLLAAHVRTNHVHCVVLASNKPEKIMNDFKAYASRLLNESGLDEPGRKRWARHGSTKYLWTLEQATAAVNYVLFQQGEAMATYDGVGATDWRT